jgi:uncharacterized protein YkwD
MSLLPFALALAACGGGGGESAQPSSTSEPSSHSALAAASASATASTPASSSDATASLSADTTCGLSGFQQEIIERINAARAASRMCGDTLYQAPPPLGWNDKLYAAAVGHATDMGSQNYFSHTSLDGRTFSQRITNAGYTWNTAGENIAAGQTSIDEVMKDWLQSPGHCANIMKSAYTEVGAACVKNAASTYKEYWAMEFGTTN